MDKGSAASGGDKAMAVLSVITLGKGSEAEKGASVVGSGVYRLVFSNGREYIGKGLATRAGISVKRLLAALNAGKAEAEHVTISRVEPKMVPGGSREAFKEESRMIQDAGGAQSQNPDTNLLNKIDSPGTKYRAEDSE